MPWSHPSFGLAFASITYGTLVTRGWRALPTYAAFTISGACASNIDWWSQRRWRLPDAPPMARRPQRKTQAASLASYAICSDLRARIRLRWRTTRRRSSHPRRRPSLRPPNRNIPRGSSGSPSGQTPRAASEQEGNCPRAQARSDRRALSRRVRPRARSLPCSVARRRPSPSEASTTASALRIKPDRRT